jgi:hypothetical protein
MAVKVVDFYEWDDDSGYYYVGKRTVNTDNIDHIRAHPDYSYYYIIVFHSGNEIVINSDDFETLAELMDN